MSMGQSIEIQQHSFFQDVEYYFDRAAAFTKLPKGLLEQIKVCNNVYEFRFPVRVGSQLMLYTGWRGWEMVYRHRVAVAEEN